MTTLFPEPEITAPSPKAAWLAKHRLHTRKEDLPRWNSGPRNQEPWVCENAGGTYRGTGTTEHDACLDYAVRYGVKHWTVEGWEEMMADMGREMEDLSRKCVEATPAIIEQLGQMAELEEIT